MLTATAAQGVSSEADLSRYLGYDKGLLQRRRRKHLDLFSEVDYRLVAAECFYTVQWLKTGSGPARKSQTRVGDLSPVYQELLAVAQMIPEEVHPTMQACLRLLALGEPTIVQMIEMPVKSIEENIRLGSTMWRQHTDG
jgi:hypothetical protein